MTSKTDGVEFDINGDGFTESIGWTALGSTDAFLALDRNGDGAIDNGTELFGNWTSQPASRTPNGFTALAEFDKPEYGGNGNGEIDEGDEVFSHLVLWIDSNHNGISEQQELLSLTTARIVTISLDYRSSHRRDDYGNIFRYRSRVRFETGEYRWATDVFLTTH